MNHSISQQQLPLSFDQADAAWQVRISHRSRRLSVRVYPAGNVVVIAPKFTPPKLIQEFIAKHRDWINLRVDECTARQLAMVPPTELILPSIEQFIQIEYRQESTQAKLRSLGQGQLLLRGNLIETRTWSRLLTSWLTELAQHELELRLRKLAFVLHDDKEEVDDEDNESGSTLDSFIPSEESILVLTSREEKKFFD